MELFYAYKIEDGCAWLDAEESAHCVRVLRHRSGDGIAVIGPSATGKPAAGKRPSATGKGPGIKAEPAAGKSHGLHAASQPCTGKWSADGIPAALYRCVVSDESPKGVVARVVAVQEGWGAHPYYLRMAVCPTKNIDRYEWFVEKAVELGVDEIVPIIGEHSERRVVRVDRLQKVAIAAAKQSLKGCVPVIAEPISVLDFIASSIQGKAADCPGSSDIDIRLIAYCSDDVAPRGSILDALTAACESVSTAGEGKAGAHITVLIGPEGDFSQSEVAAAIAAGFDPVHLGPSRLRTETAAITAVETAYLTLGLSSPAYDSEKSAKCD